MTVNIPTDHIKCIFDGASRSMFATCEHQAFTADEAIKSDNEKHILNFFYL